MISSMDVNLLVSGTMGFQLLFIRTDAANTQRKYLTNGCPLTAMVKAVVIKHVISSNASLAVGGPSQRNISGFLKDKVRCFNCIPHGVDVRNTGLHTGIDAYTSPFTHFEPGYCGKAVLRFYPDGENNDVGLHKATVRQCNAESRFCPQHLGECRSETQIHAMIPDFLMQG